MNITGKTSYAAVIGHPIAHSLSPTLHNSIYHHLKLDIAYGAFDVLPETFGEAVEGLAALGFLGFNVTIPYKERIIAYLDEIEPTAAAIGAVNTVKIEGGRLIGYNTDGLGFLNSMEMNNIQCQGQRILLLGAGGSARAIGVSLVSKGPKEILILNRSPIRGKQLAEDINSFAGQDISLALDKAPQDIDIIINTTPLGMWPKVDENPLSGYIFNRQTKVCDIIYNPSKTLLLREAEKAGCFTLGGIGMLVGQGIKAIEIWTGETVHDPIVELVTKELSGVLTK